MKWQLLSREEKIFRVVFWVIMTPVLLGAFSALETIKETGILSFYESFASMITLGMLMFYAVVSYTDSCEKEIEKRTTTTFKYIGGDRWFVTDFEAFIDKHCDADESGKKDAAKRFIREAVYSAMRVYEEENRKL